MNFCSCVIKNRDIKTKEQIKQDRRTEEQKAFQPQTYELMFLCLKQKLMNLCSYVKEETYELMFLCLKQKRQPTHLLTQ